MLFKNIKKLSPALAAYAEKVSPELKEEDVELYMPKSIPKSRRFVGRSFMFSYRTPQGKGTKDLPYFHHCPLVILLEQTEDSILALNPFYLRPDQREELVLGLQNALIGQPDDPETRVRITYKMIAKYRRRWRTAFPCIKRYQHQRMSRIVIGLKPDLWKEFYLGDVARRHELFFQGKNANGVWNESFKTIKQNLVRRKKK